MKKVWVATAVDMSDTSDGKAWTIGFYAAMRGIDALSDVCDELRDQFRKVD